MSGLPPDVRLPRHGTVVLFSDFLSPLDEIQALIGRFAAVPVTGYLLQILDPAETALPYQGRIRFRGLESDGDALIPRVESVRDAYAERLKAQQDGIAVDLRRRRLRLWRPPHRPSAGDGAADAVSGVGGAR